MVGKKRKSISAEEFDRLAEEGKDLTPYIDTETAVQRVNIDFPAWVITFLDNESKRQGITRQSLIKTWIVQKIDDMKHNKSA